MGFLIVFQIERNLHIGGENRAEIDLIDLDDFSDVSLTGTQGECTLPCQDRQPPISKFHDNCLAFCLPLILWDGANLFSFNLDVGSRSQQPGNLLEYQIVVEFVHFESVGGEVVFLTDRGMDKSVDGGTQ